MKLQDKIKTRIWIWKGSLNYYNFKSKTELGKGQNGDMAVVNDRLVTWNHYTKRWNTAKQFQENVKN